MYRCGERVQDLSLFVVVLSTIFTHPIYPSAFPYIPDYPPFLTSPIDRIGVATPLMALHLGHHLALLSRYSDSRIALVVSDTNNVVGGGVVPSSTNTVNNGRKDTWKEIGIVIAFVVSTVLLILVPLFVADKKWTYLTYTGLCRTKLTQHCWLFYVCFCFMYIS